MSLRGWFTLIALCVGCGLVQVAWRHAILMKGYEVGERLSRLMRSQTEVGRLTTEVVALESPAQLARVAEERRLELVPRSVLPMGLPDQLLQTAAARDVTD